MNCLTNENNFIVDLRECFIFSKQTNLEDLRNPGYYNYLEWVEFLEFMCRVAMAYAKQKIADGDTNYPTEVQHQVYGFLELIWKWREVNPKPEWLLFHGKFLHGRVNTTPMTGRVDVKIYAPLKKK